MIMLDIDRFKLLNDGYGHIFGDSLLKGMSGIIITELRRSDLPARYGGDEFSIICPETNYRDAGKLCERIRAMFGDAVFMARRGQVKNQTASFGVTEYHPGESPEDFLHRADNALYTAKQEGRNRVVLIHRDNYRVELPYDPASRHKKLA